MGATGRYDFVYGRPLGHAERSQVTAAVIRRSSNGGSGANVPAHLLAVTSPCKITHAHCRPSQIGHKLGKVPVSTRGTLALLHPKNIQQRLRGDALQAIEACRSARAFQSQAPGVYGLRGFGCAAFMLSTH